jgi:hypothetical protein
MLTHIRRTQIGAPERRVRPRVIGATALALCLTLVAACGSGDKAAGPGGDGDPNTPRTAVPDELVGQWYSGDVSPTDYYDPNTGSWSGSGYGEGLMYTFTRDGRYEFAFQLTSRLYDCYTLTQFYVRGTMTVDQSAASYQLHPSSAKKIERSNCGGGNSDSAFQDDGESNYYQVRQADDGGIELYVRPTDGSSGWAKMRRVAD